MEVFVRYANDYANIKEQINYLNQVIADQNNPQCKLITNADKDCNIKFLKYEN